MAFSDMKCTAEASIPGNFGYYGDVKADMDNARQCDNVRQECGSLNELTTNACMGVQIGEQYPYSPPYANINLPEEKKEMQITVSIFKAIQCSTKFLVILICLGQFMIQDLNHGFHVSFPCLTRIHTNRLVFKHVLFSICWFHVWYLDLCILF